MIGVPDAPKGLTALLLYDGVVLSWSKPDFNGGFDPFQYRVYVDGDQVAVLSELSYRIDLGVDVHQLSVRAENINGISEATSIEVDLARSLEIDYPSDGATLRPGNVTVAWDCIQGAEIVSRFVILLDGDEVAELYGYHRSWELIPKVGSHVIEVRAVDSDGKYISEQTSIVVSADFDDGTFQYTLTGDYGDGPAIITGYTGTGGDVIIPETLGDSIVGAIGDGAFAGNGDIVSVTMPASVTSIGAGVLDGCTALNSVHFEGDAPTVDGDLSDQTGITIYYTEGAQGFSSIWAGASTQAISAPSDGGYDDLILLLSAVVIIGVLGVIAFLVIRRVLK